MPYQPITFTAYNNRYNEKGIYKRTRSGREYSQSVF